MTRRKGFLAAMVAVAAFAAPRADLMAAQSSDYRIEAVNPHVAGNGMGAVELRMVHRPSGKVVDVATVLDSRLEMPMNGTTPMLGRVQHAPISGSSAIRFVVSVPMEGEWLLSVTAKPSGEKTAVHDVVPIYVERTSTKWGVGAPRRQ